MSVNFVLNTPDTVTRFTLPASVVNADAIAKEASLAAAKNLKLIVNACTIIEGYSLAIIGVTVLTACGLYMANRPENKALTGTEDSKKQSWITTAKVNRNIPYLLLGIIFLFSIGISVKAMELHNKMQFKLLGLPVPTPKEPMLSFPPAVKNFI